MKGIILAGGKGSRLYPVTRAVCKQLLPVYNKPMVYYPLSALMLAGIKDVLVISSPEYLPGFEALLGNGSEIGMNIFYSEQIAPRGIAEALIIAEDFIGNDRCCLVLGDNIFYGYGLSGLLKDIVKDRSGATILGYYVRHPQRYGVLGFDKKGKVTSITEKPKEPASNYAVTGMYFYDKDAANIARSIKPSRRNELEITDVNKEYLKRNKLKARLLGRGYAWLDMGSYDSLIEASIFIKTMQERQGLEIGSIEEVAFRMGYINRKQLMALGKKMDTSYGEYLVRIAQYEK